MIRLLRFIGVVNAGVWFGAALFVTFFAGPAFFSDAMLVALKHRYYAGLAAQIVLGRYFILHYLCAGVALMHLLVEWFYLGRRHSRTIIWLWALLTALILAGGLQVQPKLHDLHQTMYYGVTAAEQAAAAQSFRTWHIVSQTGNLVVLAGLLVFFWRVVFPPPDQLRFGGYGKYWG